MSPSHTLTPTLSRAREKEQQFGPVAPASNSLSRTWERAGARVRVSARALREGQIDAEALLWSRLRDRPLSNLKFRRQRPIGLYFADFVCLEIGLVVDFDGAQHTDGASFDYDQKRSSDMATLGFQTLRFWNNDVLTQTDAVLEKILQIAETFTPALSPQRETAQDNPGRAP